ncbi:MAG TPA: hypothetical protein VF698_05950, partial [Thermoanaerobaculia bacterium]
MYRDLISLTDALRAAQARAEAMTGQLSTADADKMRRALDEQRLLLAELSEYAAKLEERLTQVHDTVADRMNNVLMCVQTVSDLLRRPPTPDAAEDLRQRLQTTVETGRDAVRRIRAG